MRPRYHVGILLVLVGIMLICAVLRGPPTPTRTGIIQCEVYPGGMIVCIGIDSDARTVYCYKGSQEHADERRLQRCPEIVDPAPFILIGILGIIIVLVVILEVRERRSRMERKPPIAPQLASGCYCRYCGRQISLDSVFCPRCGRQLT